MKVICPYCNKEAEKVTGQVMYPHRQDLHALIFWRCVPCKAHVGTRKNSDGVPLGKLANKEDRLARWAAHSRFKNFVLFSSPPIGKPLAYKLLAAHMKLPREECNIGNFTKDQCKEVQEFCDIYFKSSIDKKAS